jgi:hypothetical protein
MAARRGRSVDVPDAEPIAQKESSAAKTDGAARPRCRRHECLWAFKMRDALPAMAQATATSTMAINKPPHQNPAQPAYPGARAPAGHPDRADLSEPKGVNGR